MNCIKSLLNKKVINISTGDELGCVCDILVDTSCGSVAQIAVPAKSGVLSLFCKDDFIYINWSDIVKIGSELILVSCKFKKDT